jgi:hypothetical protein
MTCPHVRFERPGFNPGNRVTGAGAACRRGFSGPSHLARLHFTKGYPNG